jgi:hypothetical protein
MKKTFFWISMLFSFILSIGCGEKGTESGIPDTSKSSAVRCDTQAVIRAYFEKMGYSTKNIGHFDSSTTMLNAFTPPLFAPIPRAMLKMGQLISLSAADAKVENYLTTIAAGDEKTQLRSFFVDAHVFYDYFSHDPDAPITIPTGNKIKYFKLILCNDNTREVPVMSLVVVPYDATGNYITIGSEVYNQIAGCPSACPEVGQAAFDNVFTGTVSATYSRPPGHTQIIRGK